MKIYIFFTLLIFQNSFGQDQMKIDSVFKRNFKIIEIELGVRKNINVNDKTYFEEIVIDDSGQKVYINKNLPESISFFETLTKIKARVEYKAQSVVPIIDTKIYKSWKNWYKKNKKNITWCPKEKLPSLKNNYH